MAHPPRQSRLTGMTQFIDLPEGDPSETLAGGTAFAKLRDGRAVTIREVEPSDEGAIEEFLSGLGLEARRLRFFTGGIDIARMAHTIAPARAGRLGLVSLDSSGRVVGHAIAIELSDGRAEVALEVADELHGLGLGTILVERLAELAESRGISTLVAEVLPDNRAMLDVFRDGFDAHVKWSNGVDEVELPSSSWRLARGRYGSMFPGGGEAPGGADVPEE